VNAAELADGFLPAVPTFQCDEGIDYDDISINTQVNFILIRINGLKSTRAGFKIREALRLRQERAIRVREKIIIGPDVFERSQVALHQRLTIFGYHLLYFLRGAVILASLLTLRLG
jgi:hypothetical protein